MTLKIRIALFLVSLSALTLSGQDVLVFSSGGMDHPVVPYARKVLEMAYGRMGYTLSIRTSVTDRSFLEAEYGRVDGLLFGGEEAASAYGNILKVPFPLDLDDIVVFSRDPSLRIGNVGDLRDYTIGVVEGMYEAEVMAAGMRQDPVADPDLLFRKLEAGRLDVVLLPRNLGLSIIGSLDLRDITIVSPSLRTTGLYHYLHRSHGDLIPALTAILEEMERDGSIDDLRRAYLPE